MPESTTEVALWIGGAGYLNGSDDAINTIIDLQTLDPFGKASGAVIYCEDERFLEEIRIYASVGVTKGPVWNDKVIRPRIDGLIDDLVYDYWQQNMDSLVEKTKKRDGIRILSGVLCFLEAP